MPAIHKHFGDKKLEDAAFALKVGEISSLLPMEGGTWVILLCEKHVAANPTVSFENESMKLHKEMEDLRVAQRIRAGTVWINAYRTVGPNMPFGGFGASGIGRENGTAVLHEYTETRSIWIETSGATRDPFTLG